MAVSSNLIDSPAEQQSLEVEGEKFQRYLYMQTEYYARQSTRLLDRRERGRGK